MKEQIKSKIENFVLKEMDKIQENNESDNVGNRNYAIENVKEFIKILQEEDKIENDFQLEALKIEYDKKYNRGDIVVVNYFNGEKEERLIKRVMGLPGEKVEYNENKLYINDKKVEDRFAKDTENFELSYIDIDMKKIPEGYYFVIGDNRNNSIDSRIIGLVKKEDIKGTVTQSLIPFKKVK